MTTESNDIAAYVGLYAPQTYTLRTDKAYAIEAFEFDFTNHAGSTSPIRRHNISQPKVTAAPQPRLRSTEKTKVSY